MGERWKRRGRPWWTLVCSLSSPFLSCSGPSSSRCGTECLTPLLPLLAGCQQSALVSSIVRIGKTTVVCNILGEFATPEEETPDRGFLGTCGERNRAVPFFLFAIEGHPHSSHSHQ